MESGDREKFLEWYESKKDKIFDFQKEIHEYCFSDVDILRRGCMKFRNLLMEDIPVTWKIAYPRN
jgi:hypothetical protein